MNTLHRIDNRPIEMEDSITFKKFDSDKVDLSLMEPSAERHYCTIGGFGAEKYGRNNWKLAKLEDISRYYAAMKRHENAELSGEYLDPESNKPHGWHSLWNRIAVNYFIEKYGYEKVMNHIRGIK